MEILEEFSGSTDQNMIVKGKRTRRPRPSSSTSSSIGGDFYNSLVSHSSPTTSSVISTSREEDEDMANCLILLARGTSPPQPITPPPEKKSGSRKFTEMATSADRKVGIYVYECKTCNRTFASFQALGGHRASHKRPKPTADNDQKKSPPPPPPDNPEEGGRFGTITITPPPSTQLPSKNCDHPNKPKIHECSICGSEFASGQALGGHMRRHRPAAPSSSSNDSSPPKNMLGLDLNLPAPPEDEKFHQFPTKQKPRLVFAAAALVDCHY